MGDPEPKPKKRPRVVQSTLLDHSYQDYSTAPIQPGVEIVDGRVSSFQSMNFPVKLHRILSTPEYEHIIGWMPHGRSWAVKNKQLLESVVLTEHFNHARFESFNRQVNIWGFKRLRGAGMDYKTYYHEAFLRGRPDLTQLVRRLKNPGKRIPNVEAEPNFYEMSFMPELPAHQHQNTLTLSNPRSANAPERVMTNSSQNQIGPSAHGLNADSNDLRLPSSPNYQQTVAGAGVAPQLQQLLGQTSTPINIAVAQTLLNNATNLQALQALQASSFQWPNNMSLFGGTSGIQGAGQIIQQQQQNTTSLLPGFVPGVSNQSNNISSLGQLQNSSFQLPLAGASSNQPGLPNISVLGAMAQLQGAGQIQQLHQQQQNMTLQVPAASFGLPNQPNTLFPSISQISNVPCQPPGATTSGGGQPILPNMSSGGLAGLQSSQQLRPTAYLPSQLNMAYPSVLQTTGELQSSNIGSESERPSSGPDETIPLQHLDASRSSQDDAPSFHLDKKPESQSDS